MDYILWYIGRRSKVLFWETTKTNLKYNKTSNNFTIQEYFISSVLGTNVRYMMLRNNILISTLKILRIGLFL